MKHHTYLVFLPLLLVASGACNEPAEQGAERAKAVKTMVVSEALRSNTRSLSGTVRTADRSDLSFRVKGRVESVLVKRGDAVARDQVLATLEQKDYLLAVKSAKARLQSARAETDEKREALRRQRQLLEEDFVSRASADKAESAYQSALSDVAVAETELQTAEQNLERTTLRAPFAGKIAERKVEPFTEVSAGGSVFTLQGADSLEVDILVPETMIHDVAHGDVVSVAFPAVAGARVGGVITEVAAASATGNAFPVTVRLAETVADLRPGMSAEVRLSVESTSGAAVFLIPTTAIDLRFFDEEVEHSRTQAHLFVVNETDNTLRLTEVRSTDVRGNQVEVTGGLAEGDRIVTAGVAFLNDGQKVKLWQPQYSVPATLDK